MRGKLSHADIRIGGTTCINSLNYVSSRKVYVETPPGEGDATVVHNCRWYICTAHLATRIARLHVAALARVTCVGGSHATGRRGHVYRQVPL